MGRACPTVSDGPQLLARARLYRRKPRCRRRRNRRLQCAPGTARYHGRGSRQSTARPPARSVRGYLLRRGPAAAPVRAGISGVCGSCVSPQKPTGLAPSRVSEQNKKKDKQTARMNRSTTTTSTGGQPTQLDLNTKWIKVFLFHWLRTGGYMPYLAASMYSWPIYTSALLIWYYTQLSHFPSWRAGHARPPV